ncbi:hypothetical protein [Staphylococcus warneri]|uniref:hypothetical protein n=1 Tax=Staphylococcus warneri TaxID=1292 RepID=UPI0005E56254|nr:hypothetical protein [Staphylococcus warneri]MBJ7888657.1 hypothetical protein [Bacillaceae bacterium HSR45]PTI80826.1 hypothetical protein BU077_11570 [Staphylococcus warneri]COE51270.1 Uncharacterised protein [Staphylococcus warneri]
MKKVFASLGVILLVVILGVAVVFAYGSYKDLELKKEEAKLEDKKNKKIDKNKNTENENQNQINNQTITTPNEKAKHGNNLGVQEKSADKNDPNGVLRFDTNGDGFISTSEVTPEAQKLVDEGKLQPSSDRMVEEWTKNKNNVDNTYDYDESYKKQQEMYKKAARGEVPEPGETIK